MNLRELKNTLSDLGVIPSRKLGQNFLIDQNIAQGIVEHLEISPEDTVVEVGPGLGSLTEHLIGKARQIILVEFDARLADYLTQKYSSYSEIQVLHQDAARFNIKSLFAEQPVKLLGNLPYSAGGAIMKNFLKGPTPISRAVLMLQKEFVQRILAKPRSKDYGVLTLRMQSEWESRPLKTIGPAAFSPPPIIDSTTLLCTPKKTNTAYHKTLFDSLIRQGFAQRRKQLHNAMPKSPPWIEVVEKLDCPKTVRAEELSLEQWVQLTQSYEDSPTTAQNPNEIFDVVDKEDNVLKQATRQEVHEQNLIHRAVHIFVYNKKGEVLLQKRSLLKDLDPGKWGTSAAGHLDASETYLQSALRELQEELGLKTKPEELNELTKIPPSKQTGWEHVLIYQLQHQGSVQHNSSETEFTMWIAPEILEQWLQKRPQDFAKSFSTCWGLAKCSAAKSSS